MASSLARKTAFNIYVIGVFAFPTRPWTSIPRWRSSSGWESAASPAACRVTEGQSEARAAKLTIAACPCYWGDQLSFQGQVWPLNLCSLSLFPYVRIQGSGDDSEFLVSGGRRCIIAGLAADRESAYCSARDCILRQPCSVEYEMLPTYLSGRYLARYPPAPCWNSVPPFPAVARWITGGGAYEVGRFRAE